MPARIQRKRTKGWKMPEGAVCVSRPGRWGNPFRGEDAASLYRRWLAGQMSVREFMDRADGQYSFSDYRSLAFTVHALEGHDLACWCDPSAACHADVLLELANSSVTHASQ